MTLRYAFTANIAVTVSVDAETLEAAEARALALIRAGVVVIDDPDCSDQHTLSYEIEGDLTHG